MISIHRITWLALMWHVLSVQGFVPSGTTTGHQQLNNLQHQRQANTDQPLSLLHATSSTSIRESQPLPQLSPLEDWCVHKVEEWYQRAASVKCPFFKRRFVDGLDGIDMILRFLVIRHKSLDIFGPPPGHRSKFCSEQKTKHLTCTQLADAIRSDWKEETGMGYYITGNLNTKIFRDDCLFMGPDPDMPVQGLRKYVNAASQLFDRSTSRAELLSLDIASGGSSDDSTERVVVKWRMNGVLRLPWKPTLPEWTGSTTYHLDEDGLVYRHEETWDMSVWQAFLKTFAPELAETLQDVLWASDDTIDIDIDSAVERWP